MGLWNREGLRLKKFTNLQKEKNESDYHYAYRALFDAVMCMELEPGKVLSEAEIMEQLQLGRTPIREAIMRLRDCRLVEVQPKKSSYVSKIDLNYVEEGVLIRESIETNILRDAIHNVPAKYITLMNINLNKQEEALRENRKLDFWNLDNEFHELLYMAMNKPWSWEIVTQATTHLNRVRYLMMLTGMSSDEQTYQGHVEIFERILNKDMPELDGYLYNQITSCYRKNLPELMRLYPTYFT